MIDRPTEIGKCCGMGTKGGMGAKLMRISKYPFQVQLMIDHKQVENGSIYSDIK